MSDFRGSPAWIKENIVKLLLSSADDITIFLLKEAIWRAAEKCGGMGIFSDKANVRLMEIYQCAVEDKLPEESTLHKIFPLIFLELRNLFNAYVSKESESELSQFLKESDFFVGDDLRVAMDEVMQRFEKSPMRAKHERIAEMLNMLTASMMDTDAMLE